MTVSPTPRREGLQSGLSNRTILTVRALIGCVVSEVGKSRLCRSTEKQLFQRKKEKSDAS